MEKCLVCSQPINGFMSFGRMPLANGFLTKKQFDEEYFYDLEVAFCTNCHMFQLLNQPEREMMFNENYAFFSGTSEHMTLHFEKFSNHVVLNHLTDKENPFVVEIGSNDGIMLNNFSERGIRHLGIEPSKNVAEVAMARGINTIVSFFDKELAEKIVHEYGQADAYIAANVMCHIPYIKSIVEGIKILLKPDGVAIFEDPYLGDVIQKVTYDQIYDEHMLLFSVHSIQFLFALFDMEVIDVESQDTHGGSMRYVLAHKGAKPISKNVQKQLDYEQKIGLNNPDTYHIFRERCEQYRTKLMRLIEEIKNQGKSIVGYAATSKSTTIINYCGMTSNHLDYICDTTPIKQGKYSPGAHIRIKPYDEFRQHYPDYALLFAYNHEKEIMAKEQDFMSQGGKWIEYVPEVRIRE